MNSITIRPKETFEEQVERGSKYIQAASHLRNWARIHRGSDARLKVLSDVNDCLRAYAIKYAGRELAWLQDDRPQFLLGMEIVVMEAPTDRRRWPVMEIE
jgi:hypothetical protein